MISHGVEISIAKGGHQTRKMVGDRSLSCFFWFFSFSVYFIYSLLRYKISHGVLAMAKTKPKIENKQTKEKPVTNHLQ